MKITIELDTFDSGDLAGLAALVAAIGGRTPPVQAPAVTLPLQDGPSGAVSERTGSRPAGTAQTSDGPTESTDLPQADSNGLPWDDRIHSTPATVNADGSWRKRRGVTDEAFAAISAELKGTARPTAAQDAPAPSAGAIAGGASDSDPVVPTPSPSPDAPQPPAPTPAPVPPAPTESATPAATPAANPGDSRYATYGALVQDMNGRPGAVYAKLNEHAQTLGLADFKSLKDRPDMWDMFVDSWGA